MKRNGNIWAKVLLGIIGVAAAIWMIIVSLGAAGTREWEQYAASLRAKGQPITFAEIEARRAVIPEDQNSARIIEGLAAALNEHRGGAITLDSLVSGSKETGDFFTGLKRGRIDLAREFLSKHEDILTRLADMRDKPRGRFKIEYDQKNPLGTMIPHMPHLRSASKLVRMHSTLSLIEGNQAGAVDDFELQSRLAGTITDDPILIGRLVQISIQSQAIATAEDMLRAGTTDDQSLKRMAAELGVMRQNATLKWGLLGERAFFVETCEAVVAGRIPLTGLDPQTNIGELAVLELLQQFLRFPAFLMRSNQLRGAQIHTSLIDAVNDPKALYAAAKKIDDEVPNLPRTQMLVKILMPSLSRAVMLNTRISAQLDCAIAALAAERFRMAGGKLPTSLDQLVPAYLPTVPIDPFDGKPLRVAQTREGIAIYSVDENGIDDGGDIASRKVGVRTITPDRGFRLNDADHRGVLLVDDPPSEDD